MNTWTKRGTLLILAALMLVVGMMIPYRDAEAAMTYNNTLSANISCAVDSSGCLQASLAVSGIKGKTTRIKAELYVEKRVLGMFWSRVDIGYNNNIWEDSTTNHTYYNTFNTDLPSNGTYRTTVTFTVSGSGGTDDIIVKTSTITY